MQFKRPEQALQQVIRLSHEMITLADSGDEVREDRECGILFGRLRDEGYALRNLARKELERHGATATEATASPAADGSRKTVLVVDDDPDVVRYLTAWFDDEGYATLTACNGFEAIELASAHQPDLISLDMSMPEKSGVSTYRDLKGDPVLGQIPVIIITAIGRAFEEFLHRRRGVPDPEGFIAKPIDLEELQTTVSNILS